jgi:hypothetical protein
VTEFLTAEEVSAPETHRRLKSVFRERAVDMRVMRRWVRHFRSGETVGGQATL